MNFDQINQKRRRKVKGKIAGILYTVFGGIGMGITGVCLLVTSILSLAMGSFYMINTPFLIIWGVLFVAFSWMCGYGSVIRNRLNRLKRYSKLLEGKTYCSIKELSSYMGKSETYILRDMQKLIDLEAFPEGHLDQKGTCLMLSDETYGQYLQAQESLEEREKAEREKVEREKTERKKTEREKPKQTKTDRQSKEALKTAPVSDPLSHMEHTGNDRLDAMIEEGNRYIRKLREVNDTIPGEIISAKLYRLEAVTGKIFAAIQKRPQQMTQMQRFMDYYLPTTLKLVTTYQEFDSVDIPGDNITGAKAEIEQTLDTINLAFEKLLDDLYRDAAFDASADATVLQAMLAREGLAESDFKEEADHE